MAGGDMRRSARFGRLRLAAAGVLVMAVSVMLSGAAARKADPCPGRLPRPLGNRETVLLQVQLTDDYLLAVINGEHIAAHERLVDSVAAVAKCEQFLFPSGKGTDCQQKWQQYSVSGPPQATYIPSAPIVAPALQPQQFLL